MEKNAEQDKNEPINLRYNPIKCRCSESVVASRRRESLSSSSELVEWLHNVCILKYRETVLSNSEYLYKFIIFQIYSFDFLYDDKSKKVQVSLTNELSASWGLVLRKYIFPYNIFRFNYFHTGFVLGSLITILTSIGNFCSPFINLLSNKKLSVTQAYFKDVLISAHSIIEMWSFVWQKIKPILKQ